MCIALKSDKTSFNGSTICSETAEFTFFGPPCMYTAVIQQIFGQGPCCTSEVSAGHNHQVRVHCFLVY